MKGKYVFLLVVVFFAVGASAVSSDWGFSNLLLILNLVPDTPDVTESFADGLNRTTSDLNCSSLLIDDDGDS